MGNFVHIELNTTDAPAAKGFYQKVFGWKMADMPMPDGSTYSMAQGMVNPGIGLQGVAAPNMPSAWVPYIEVDDVKKAVAKATKAGAHATVEYFQAGEHGEGAWLIDPTGAMFAIWHSTPRPATKKKATKKKAAKKKAAKKKAAKKKAAKKKATKKKATKKKATKKKATKKKTAKKKTAKRKAKRKAAKKR